MLDTLLVDTRADLDVPAAFSAVDSNLRVRLEGHITEEGKCGDLPGEASMREIPKYQQSVSMKRYETDVVRHFWRTLSDISYQLSSLVVFPRTHLHVSHVEAVLYH